MKKLFAVLMAMLIVFSICVPSFAVEIDNTNTSGNAIATYEANSSFKVTIPTYIAPSEKGETASANMYSVTASDVFIPDGNQLTVTVDYDGVLTDRNGVEIPYKLFSGGSEVTNGQKIIAKDAGNPDDTATVNFSAAVQAEPRYAGTYIDNVTFNISVEERVYSLEEINADEHLYAIGKTKPEYVVAKFNDDYSEVTVVKNGSESDGKMKSFSSSTTLAANHTKLTSACILNDVVNIGDYAFYNCDMLTNIEIPESVTDIGMATFYGCQSLTSIHIPEKVTMIYPNTFYRCKSLKNINIPNNVKSIGTNAFYGCIVLTNVIIPNSVTNIGSGAFSSCAALKSIEIPESVKSIGMKAFESCRSLTNVILPEDITRIESYAFNCCSSLVEINIPKSVTSIGNNAFSTCWALTNIDIPESVTSIESFAFSDCRNLTDAYISASVTDIASTAFNYSGLKTIYGVSGSYAETFAGENGYTFIAQS